MWLLSFSLLMTCKGAACIFQAQQPPLFAGRLLGSKHHISLLFPIFSSTVGVEEVLPHQCLRQLVEMDKMAPLGSFFLSLMLFAL